MRRTDFIAAALCGGSWLIPACKEDVRPVSGRWEYHQRAETKNTCQFAARVDLQIGSFSLTADGDGTFIVDAQDGSSSIVCDIDGDDFDCELAVVFSYDGRAELNVDALVEITVHHSGTFNSSVEGEGTSYYLTTCAGNDCGLASLSLGGVDFPCEIERTFHIQASRE